MNASVENAALYTRWIQDLWNGPADPAALTQIAHTIVADDFVGHWPDRDIHGPAELADTIAQTKTMFATLAFEITVPPITSGEMTAGRWIGHGTSTDGDNSGFLGNDILRVHGGRFVEYWACSMPLPD